MAIEITLRPTNGSSAEGQGHFRIQLSSSYGCRTAWDAHLLIACTLAASDPAVIEDAEGTAWTFPRRSVELVSAAVVTP